MSMHEEPVELDPINEDEESYVYFTQITIQDPSGLQDIPDMQPNTRLVLRWRNATLEIRAGSFMALVEVDKR